MGVNAQIMRMLKRRIELLASVKSLAFTIGITNFQTFACDTAAYLFKYEVVPLWQKFLEEIEEKDGKIQQLFPFTSFIRAAIQNSINGKKEGVYERKQGEGQGDTKEQGKEQGGQQVKIFSGDQLKDIQLANLYWAQVQGIFNELKECEAFEILQGDAPRIAYLISIQAKIVVCSLPFLISQLKYFKQVIMENAKFSTCFVLGAQKFLDEEVLIVLNSITSQKKMKSSLVFMANDQEEMRRKSVEQIQISRLILLTDKQKSKRAQIQLLERFHFLDRFKI